MSPSPGPRPGGRSARIQKAVHATTAALLEERDRSAITVPMIAERAGVTPSTIYRRWGDIGEVFADVALERLRPDAPPADTGTLRGDLVVWARDYLEEMSAPVGRASLQDIVTSGHADETDKGGKKVTCASFCRLQIEAILGRGGVESQPLTESVIDHVVAPIIYRILFDLEPLERGSIGRLVDRALAETDS